MILGVSDWLSKKLNVETKYIRLGFVLSVLLAGFGIGAYIILWLVKVISKE